MPRKKDEAPGDWRSLFRHAVSMVPTLGCGLDRAVPYYEDVIAGTPALQKRAFRLAARFLVHQVRNRLRRDAERPAGGAPEAPPEPAAEEELQPRPPRKPAAPTYTEEEHQNIVRGYEASYGWRLPSGKALGDATRKDLREAVKSFFGSGKGTYRRGYFALYVLEDLPDDVTPVRRLIQEGKLPTYLDRATRTVAKLP